MFAVLDEGTLPSCQAQRILYFRALAAAEVPLLRKVWKSSPVFSLAFFREELFCGRVVPAHGIEKEGEIGTCHLQ